MCDYEPMSRGPVSIEPDMQRLTRHQGDREQLLAEYHQVADQAVKAGRKAIRVLAPRLLSLIAEPKMLRAAFDHLAEKGGQAPGHDVRRITDYSSSEAWELCRALSHAILAGTYRPGPERICRIDKGNGRGQRQLILLNVADRIVQRAVTMILQPLFDPGFDPRSFGFRRQRSHLQAVAVAENLLLTQGRRVWVIHDIKTAFEHVSIPRLLNLLHGVLPDDALSEFLRRTLGGKTLKGLPQGGSASPLMLNFYLNHFLDRPWRKAHPNIAMLRFADDLLVLCSDVQQARHVDEELRRSDPRLDGRGRTDVARLPVHASRTRLGHALDGRLLGTAGKAPLLGPHTRRLTAGCRATRVRLAQGPRPGVRVERRPQGAQSCDPHRPPFRL